MWYPPCLFHTTQWFLVLFIFPENDIACSLTWPSRVAKCLFFKLKDQWSTPPCAFKWQLFHTSNLQHLLLPHCLVTIVYCTENIKAFRRGFHWGSPTSTCTISSVLQLSCVKLTPASPGPYIAATTLLFQTVGIATLPFSVSLLPFTLSWTCLMNIQLSSPLQTVRFSPTN